MTQEHKGHCSNHRPRERMSYSSNNGEQEVKERKGARSRGKIGT